MKPPRNPLQPGEITLKEWRHREAGRLGLTVKAFEQRLSRGLIARPPMRVVNCKVMFVKLETAAQPCHAPS